MSDGRAGLVLWRIPIYLRSREAYHKEAERKIQREIDRAYQEQRHLFVCADGTPAPRDLWEQIARKHTESVKARNNPPPWQVNDIVGWIEVSAGDTGALVCARLFLPQKRISRQLKGKVYFAVDSRCVYAQPDLDLEELRKRTIAAVAALARHDRLKKLHLDLGTWRQLVVRTDLGDILRDVGIADLPEHRPPRPLDDQIREALATATELEAKGLLK